MSILVHNISKLTEGAHKYVGKLSMFKSLVLSAHRTSWGFRQHDHCTTPSTRYIQIPKEAHS